MRVKSVYAEITNRCNLNCATCYNRSGLNSECKEMPVEEIEKIVTLFRPLGLEKLHLSGGEPTLHSEFDRILDFANTYPDVIFSVTTNGTCAGKKLVRYLNTRENVQLQISLDGSCEAVNALTRGAGSFQKVISLAERIKTAAVMPRLKMVVSQNNMEDVEAFCELAFSLGFMPEFAFIRCSGNAEEEWASKALSAMQKQRILKLLARINRERGADIFLPSCTVTCPLTEGPKELGLCIKTNGDIHPCQALYGEEFAVGNLYHFDMSAFTVRVGEICALAAKRKEQDFGCARCILSGACGKGCMAEAVDLTGDPLGDDGNCEGRKQQFIARTLAKNEEFIASSN